MISISSAYAEDASCVPGFSSAWEFKQQEKIIKPTQLNKMNVCHFTKFQKNSNFKIIVSNNEKVLFENKIFWNEVQHHDHGANSDKLAPKKVKAIDYKILKIPVALTGNETFQVVHLPTGEIYGSGSLK